MKTTDLLTAVCCGLGVLFHADARAATLVYDTFPAVPYPYYVWAGGGFGVSSGGELGVSFSPFQSGYLSEIKVAISAAVSNPDTSDVDIYLRADADGQPGDPIESYGVIGQIQLDPLGPLDLASTTSPFLEAGRTYWLTVAPQTDSYNDVVWNNMGLPSDELPPYLGLGAVRFPDTGDRWFVHSFNNDNAFQVYAEAVPIPAVGWLIGSTFGLLVCKRRRVS